jgi:3-phenylpropionate/trans-cinnamate dioxygenase ferredoxin subunit
VSSSTLEQTPAGHKRRWHAVGRAGEFPDGKIKIFDLEGRSIGVVNAGGKFYAVLNICPHQFAQICRGTVHGTMLPSKPGERVYGLDNKVIRCPRHGWEFDLTTGKALFGITRSHLRMFPVIVEDEVVKVEV